MQNAKTKKTKWALSLAIIVGVITAFVIFATLLQKQTKTISINNNTLSVEIATTSQQKQTGLCCRESLAADSGMLFIYNKPGNYHFWMKDTQIPLDIVWINSAKHIVHIEPNVQPSSYPKTYGSSVPAQYVLEVNADWMAEHGVALGDTVQF